MHSFVQGRGSVDFPAFAGERIYMQEFKKQTGLPSHMRRWQMTVDAMLDGIETDGPIYLMVDQGIVEAGKTHRRGGVHIDGYWQPEIQAHGGIPYTPPGHHPQPPSQPRHIHAGTAAEALIIASSVTGCRAFNGDWSGEIGEDGDCSQVNISRLQPVDMLAGRVFAGDVFMLHESLPIPFDCLRTVVRLNVPGWKP